MKYPRTPHMPGSPGATEDDIHIPSWIPYEGKEIIISEKMDGENTTLRPDRVHARSLDSAAHPSRSWVKALHGRVAKDIPPLWRFCGENLFAKHSIHYTDLASYFLLFSVWDDRNECLSWDETEEWAALLGLSLVPVLYRGMFSVQIVEQILSNLDPKRQEGIVLRTAAGFPYASFNQHLCKWVRKGHVTTDEHWMSKPVEPNLCITTT